MMVFGVTLFQGVVTKADAGIIIGASRASNNILCAIPFYPSLNRPKESVTWDQQAGVVKRWRWADSYHFDKINGSWVRQHLVRSGWQWGWTTGPSAGHYGGTDNFSYPGVVGNHWTYFPRPLKNNGVVGVVYLGRTQAINQCFGGEKWFMNDPGDP